MSSSTYRKTPHKDVVRPTAFTSHIIVKYVSTCQQFHLSMNTPVLLRYGAWIEEVVSLKQVKCGQAKEKYPSFNDHPGEDIGAKPLLLILHSFI